MQPGHDKPAVEGAASLAGVATAMGVAARAASLVAVAAPAAVLEMAASMAAKAGGRSTCQYRR